MEETYELQANEVWAKGWDECIIKASHDQKIVFTPAAFLRLTEGIADLKEKLAEKESYVHNANHALQLSAQDHTEYVGELLKERDDLKKQIVDLQTEKHGADLALDVNTEAQTLGCRCIDMGDELASLVSTHREDFVWKDSIEDVKALIAERDALKDKFEMHLTVVRSFLAEMYATMIDPLDETPHKVEEVCRLLLERAREDRETARERDDLKVRVQNLEWRRITETDLPKRDVHEVGGRWPDGRFNTGSVGVEGTIDAWFDHGWTYFRPLNVPKEKTDAVPTDPQ